MWNYWLPWQVGWVVKHTRLRLWGPQWLHLLLREVTCFSLIWMTALGTKGATRWSLVDWRDDWVSSKLSLSVVQGLKEKSSYPERKWVSKNWVFSFRLSRGKMNLHKGVWGCENQERQDQTDQHLKEGSTGCLTAHTLTATGWLEKLLENPGGIKKNQNTAIMQGL